MSRPANTAAILLAAGAGRRYGMPKALVGDGAWLRHGVEVLSAAADPVIVVLGAQAQDAQPLVPVGARVVVAPDWAEGMGASLRAGLQALTDEDAVLIHLIDLPDVGPEVVRRVASHASPTAVARAVYRGSEGHPVLLGREHWADLATSLQGDRGARDWLAAHADVVRVECGDLAVGSDVDRPGDGAR